MGKSKFIFKTVVRSENQFNYWTNKRRQQLSNKTSNAHHCSYTVILPPKITIPMPIYTACLTWHYLGFHQFLGELHCPTPSIRVESVEYHIVRPSGLQIVDFKYRHLIGQVTVQNIRLGFVYFGDKPLSAATIKAARASDIKGVYCFVVDGTIADSIWLTWEHIRIWVRMAPSVEQEKRRKLTGGEYLVQTGFFWFTQGITGPAREHTIVVLVLRLDFCVAASAVGSLSPIWQIGVTGGVVKSPNKRHIVRWICYYFAFYPFGLV